MELTKKTKEDVVSALKRAQGALAKARERTEEAVGTVVQTMEVGSTAFALGFVNGRYGGIELMGVPLELVVAGGAHALGFLGVPQAEDLHNMGDGALAAFAATLGAGIGTDVAARTPAAPAAAAGAHAGLDPVLQRLAQFA